jgi:hypothetical protein
VASVANTVNQGIKAFDNSAEKKAEFSLRELQAKQNLELSRLAQKNALDKQEIATKSQEANQQRQAALRRAVARQRAEFGASGVSTEDGSSEAVLLGLFQETEDDKANRARLDNLRVKALDQNLSNASRVNTLERTQLKQRSNFNNSTGALDTFAKIASVF